MIAKIKINKNDFFEENTEISFLNKNGQPYSKIFFIGENGSYKTTFLKAVLRKLVINSPTMLQQKFLRDIAKDAVAIKLSNSIFVQSTNTKDAPIFVDCKFDTPLYYKNQNQILDSRKIDSIDRAYNEKTYKSYDISEYINTNEINHIGFIFNKLKDNLLNKIAKTASEVSKTHTPFVIDHNYISQSALYKVINQVNTFTSFIEIKKDSLEEMFADKDLNITTKKIKNFDLLNLTNLSSGETQLLGMFARVGESFFSPDEIPVFCFDEPETNLHPEWQTRIIDSLFSLSNDLKSNNNSQFICATHSSYIVKNYMSAENSDAVIFSIQYNETSKKMQISDIKNNNKFKLGVPTIAEINYVIFNIPTPEYFIMLYEKLVNDKGYSAKQYSQFDDDILKNISTLKQIITDGSNSQTEITRLRHLLAHGMKNEKYYKLYTSNKSNFSNYIDTIQFYDQYELSFEELLKSEINKIRDIL